MIRVRVRHPVTVGAYVRRRSRRREKGHPPCADVFDGKLVAFVEPGNDTGE